MIGQLLDADEVIQQAGEMQVRRIDIQKMEERIRANEEEINRYNRMLVSLYEDYYEDYREGLLSENEYLHLNDEYSSRIEKMQSEIDEYRAAARQYDASPLDNSELKENILKIKSKRKLTQEMVDAMVSRVE